MRQHDEPVQGNGEAHVTHREMHEERGKPQQRGTPTLSARTFLAGDASAHLLPCTPHSQLLTPLPLPLFLCNVLERQLWRAPLRRRLDGNRNAFDNTGEDQNWQQHDQQHRSDHPRHCKPHRGRNASSQPLPHHE